MTLVAALATGTAVHLLVRWVAGAPVVPRRPRRRPRGPSATRLLLLQAGVRASPAQLWLGSLLLGVVTYAVALLAIDTAAVAAAPACLAMALPRLLLVRRRGRAQQEIAQAWPDGLRELLAAVAAGMSLPQALGTLAANGPEPLRRALARLPVLMRTLGVTAALEVVREELADPTSDRIIEVLVLAHERGGRALLAVLGDLAEATAQELATAEELATSALEPALNARAVLALPWLVLTALVATPGHFRDFYQSAAGILVVAVAGAASLAGAVIVGRLGRTPLEPRVLERRGGA